MAYKEALRLSKDDPLEADRLADSNFGLVRARLADADVSATSRAVHEQKAVSSEPFSYAYQQVPCARRIFLTGACCMCSESMKQCTAG